MKLAAVSAARLRRHERTGTEAVALAVLPGGTPIISACSGLYRPLEPDLHVVRIVDVDAVDEPDLPRIGLHDERLRANAVAKKPDAFHEGTVGHARGREDQRATRREIGGPVDTLRVSDAHGLAPRLVFGGAHDEPGVDFAIQASHRSGGEHAFRRAASAHHRVHAGADDGRHDRRGEIAVADQAYAGA